MSPESISAYMMHEAIDNCLFGINGCPIPVIVEFASGEEIPIEKAYFVGGRAKAIKILVGHNLESEEDISKIEALNDQISSLESENEDLKDCKEKLDEWETIYNGAPEDFKTIWDAIEESIYQFADTAGIRLQSNDSKNIAALQKIYESTVDDLKTADEIIGELKLENLAAQRKIEELEEEIACLKVGNRALADTLEKVLPKEEV